MRRYFGWRTAVLVLLAVLGVVGSRWMNRIDDDQVLRQEIAIRTGSTDDDVFDLVKSLIADGAAEADAIDVVATVRHFGGDGVGGDGIGGGGLAEDPGSMRLLAAIEQASDADSRPSADLMIVAEHLNVGSDDLWRFLNLVVQQSAERRMPLEVAVAGLREHGFEYAYGCEVVEGASCPVEASVALTLDRQSADYERWGRTDCRASANVAHPGCLTFPDCADAYALVHSTLAAEMQSWESAKSLGHQRGSPGWDEWTGTAGDDSAASWDAHGACVAARYGTGDDAYETLVLSP